LADVQDDTPLDAACQQPACSKELIRTLLEQYEVSFSSLHMAAQRQNINAIVVILEVEPSLAVATDGVLQQTTLHKAVQATMVSKEVVERLIEAFPAARDSRDAQGNLPIDLARQSGGASPAVLELLRMP
jgi:hypothetical protein